MGDTTVGGRTRPFPGLCLRHQFGSHWIQFCITQCLPQVRPVERAGVVSPLPRVPSGMVDGVPIRRVTAMCLLHGLCQSVHLCWNGYQMDMIGHQAVADQRHAVQLNVLSQQVQIHPAVCVAVEKESATIATLGYVVRHSNGDHSGQACHDSQSNRKMVDEGIFRRALSCAQRSMIYLLGLRGRCFTTHMHLLRCRNHRSTARPSPGSPLGYG